MFSQELMNIIDEYKQGLPFKPQIYEQMNQKLEKFSQFLQNNNEDELG